MLQWFYSHYHSLLEASVFCTKPVKILVIYASLATLTVFFSTCLIFPEHVWWSEVSWPPTGLLLLPYFWGDCLGSLCFTCHSRCLFSQGQVVLVYLHLSCDQPVLLIYCHSQTTSSQSTVVMLLWLPTACGWAHMLLNPSPFYQYLKYSSMYSFSLPLLCWSNHQNHKANIKLLLKRTFRCFYVKLSNTGDLTHFIL